MSSNDTQPADVNHPEGAQIKREERLSAPNLPADDPANSYSAAIKDAAIAALLAGVLGFFFLATFVAGFWG